MINEQRIKLVFIIICFLQIFYIFHSRSNFNFDTFRDPFKQSSGIIYALEPNVIEINSIIKKNKLSSFNLSTKLLNDKYLQSTSARPSISKHKQSAHKGMFFLLS